MILIVANSSAASPQDLENTLKKAGMTHSFSFDGACIGSSDGNFAEKDDFAVIFSGVITDGREKNKSDAETILDLYEKYGKRCVNHLSGAFTFAVLDRREHLLIVVRDHLGTHPSFVGKGKSGETLFSDSLRAAMRTGLVAEDIDFASLSDVVAWQFIPTDDTIYSSVKRLTPGTMYILDLSCNRAEKLHYFVPSNEKKSLLSYTDACEFLREKILANTEARLETSSSAGTFLSGGLDSAIVTAAAAKILKRPFPVITSSSAQAVYDETDDAKRTLSFISAQTGLNFEHTIIKSPVPTFDRLSELIGLWGEPFADSSVTQLDAVCNEAKKRVDTIITGDGADELFFGYERYAAMRLMAAADAIPKAVRKAVCSVLPSGGERSKLARLKRFLSASTLDGKEAWNFIMSHNALAAAESVGAKLCPHEIVCDVANSNASPDEIFNLADVRTYLVNDCMAKSCICAEASGISLLSPFLDKTVAETALALPREFKAEGRLRKKILFDAFKDVIPAELKTRRKRGFGAPVASWLRNEWLSDAKDHLLSGNDDALSGIFPSKGIEKLLKDHATGKSDNSYVLFALITLKLFFNGKR